MYRILTAVIALLSTAAVQAAEVTAQPPTLMPGTPMLERPWPTDSQKFDFVIVGDKTSGGEDKWPVMDRAIQEINLLRPDFAIMVGDLIPGHMVDRPEWERQWAEFWSHMDSIQVPFLWVPGNHDISNPEMYRMWQEDFGRTYYSFDYRGCHFIGINTEEERFDGRGEVWTRMIDFIADDLAKSGDARHTFLFMHKPMWADARYETAWNRITEALGDRPYSAFAGHWHNLRKDDELEQRHMIVAGTGAGLGVSPLKELGHFDHYTKVTIEGDSVYLAIIEPGGPMHSENVATHSRIKEIRGMTALSVETPQNVDESHVRIPVHLRYTNPLPDTVSIATVLRNVDAETATIDGLPDSSVATLAPGEVYEHAFGVTLASGSFHDLSGLSCIVMKDGEVQFSNRHAIPLFPAETMETAKNWQVIGTFPVGDVQTRYLPEDPKRGLPGLFEPERVDVLNPEGSVEAGGVSAEWRTAGTTSDGQLNFNGIIGTEDHALAYAVAEVESEREQTVYMRLAADNFAQVLVNGEMIPRGHKYGSPGQVVWIPLPLREGKNSVAVKLVNNRGDWWLRVGFADPDGTLSYSGGEMRLMPEGNDGEQ